MSPNIIPAFLFSIADEKSIKVRVGDVHVKTMSSTAIFRDNYRHRLICAKDEGDVYNRNIWIRRDDDKNKPDEEDFLKAKEKFISSYTKNIEEIDKKEEKYKHIRDIIASTSFNDIR